MNALDTNILVRWITQDDKAQCKQVERLFADQDRFFIPSIVLCELCWVLESCYDADRHHIRLVLEKISSAEEFTLEKHEAVLQAIMDFSESKADFADCLIGRIALASGANKTLTLDKDASKLNTYQLI